MPKTRFAGLSLAALLLITGCSSDDERSADLAGIKDLLPGDYAGMMSRGKVYHTIARLQVPDFGGEVFYHHISMEAVRGPALQRKFYVFNEAGDRMRSTVLLDVGMPFPDDQAMATAIAGAAKDRLLTFPESCDIQWSKSESGFTARVFQDKCTYDSVAFKGPVSPEMTYQLSPCALKIDEGIYRPDGSPVFPPSSADNKRVGDGASAC
ncbi:MAG: hypothetical protein AAF337_08455 [Pseudomonadota bacterium]